MAQINLLKKNSFSEDFSEKIPSVLVKVLAAVLLMVLGYYGWLYSAVGKNTKELARLEKKVSDDRASALSMKERSELLVRQQQLKAFNTVTESQVYWSQLMPVLASSTLKSSIYNGLKVSPDGFVTLEVSVPNIQELDKFLQVFDLPEYNKYFSNVRIGSYSKVQDDKGTQIKFEVKFIFNPDIIKPAQKAN